MTIGPKAFGHELYSGEEVESAKNDFFDNVCHQVESMLEKRKFLIANNEVTVIDIIFYNEIATAMLIMRIKGFKR